MPDQQYIPGLGLVQSYANADTTHPTTPPIDPTVPGFHKSLLGDDLVDLVSKATKRQQQISGVKGASGNEVMGDEKEEVDEDEAPERMEPNSKLAEEAEESDEPELAEPHSNRTKKAKESDAPVGDRSRHKSVPAVDDQSHVKGPDAPTKLPDKHKMPTAEDPDVPGEDADTTEEVLEGKTIIYERETRVFVPKSQAAGTVRRAVEVDGERQYVVALDNGNVHRFGQADLQPMTAEEGSRLDSE